MQTRTASLEQDSFSRKLVASRLVRSLADALLRRRARRRLAALDREAPARLQLRTLLGLVHRARGTRFGLDHDFRRVRTADDFRRLVPLRSASALWREYGAPVLPSLSGATWPGPVHYLASCETTAGEPAAPLPVSPELVAAHREALGTALAFVHHARPRARLLSGALLLVGGGAALTPLRPVAAADTLEELARSQLPRLLRPYTAISPYSGDAALKALAERAASLPVTCLASNSGRLAKLAGFLREQTGRATLREVWPNLQAVLFSRGPSDPDRAELTHLTGSEEVLLLEACVRPEGVFAVEDPRHGLLRLMAGHGAYFEFVPLDELGRDRPERLGLGEVAPGVPYALVLTVPGLWACLAGLTVSFERLDPPLLRSVEVGLPAPPPTEVLPLRGGPPAYPPPHHPRSAGKAAGPARSFARSPWSARADQR